MYDNEYLAHNTEYPLTLTKKKDKEYNDYISSVIRDLVKEARSEKIRSERECVEIIKGRAIDEVLSWPKINTPYDREGTLLRVLLKRYNSTNRDKVAEAMGKEVFNILRFTKTSKPYTGPAVTVRHSMDDRYLAHRANLKFDLTQKHDLIKEQDKEYNDYISSVIRDLVKEARSEKIRSERECVDIIKGRAVYEVFSWPKFNLPADIEGTRDRVLLKRYNTTSIDKLAAAMGKEVFNILRVTKTSKPYTGPAVTVRHSMDDDYLAHHGILGQKWGVRRYQNEDGTLTEAGKKRYRSYDQTLETTAGLKNMARYGAPLAAGLGGVSTLFSAAPYVAAGMISTPMLLGAVAGGVVGGALSSQIARGEMFLMEKFYGMRKRHFNNKLEKDRNRAS